MKVQCLVMAQAATVDHSGRQWIAGIFDTVTMPEYHGGSVPWPPCYLFARLVWTSVEDGTHFELTYHLYGEDESEGEIGDPSPPVIWDSLPSRQGRAMQRPFITPLNLRLPKPGDYTFKLLVNGALVAELPFYLDVAPPRATQV